MTGRSATTTSGQRWARRIASAANPALGAGVGSFRRTSRNVPPSAHGRTVALIGPRPGSGTSTVAAVMALAAAGYTDNLVTVIDTNSNPPGGIAHLLGARGAGRLPVLLGVPDGEPAARSRVRAASTPGTAVPVLELPPGAGPFAPQVLGKALARLHYRSDLTIIDTPSDRSDPVFHAVLHLVDHVFVVLPADETAPDVLAGMRRWLAATPGPSRRHDLSVVLVQPSQLGSRVRPLRRWRPADLPVVVLRQDAALRRGRVGRMSRRSIVCGLELVAFGSRVPGRRV